MGKRKESEGQLPDESQVHPVGDAIEDEQAVFDGQRTKKKRKGKKVSARVVDECQAAGAESEDQEDQPPVTGYDGEKEQVVDDIQRRKMKKKCKKLSEHVV